MSKMKKAIVIMSVIVTIGCIISIGGAYAATNYAISASKIGYTDNSSIGADNVQAAIDGTCTSFSKKLDELKKSMYPVGSIYISTKLSSPTAVASAIGGTWQAFGDGRVLRSSSGESEQTGGSSTAVLTTANLPSHSHSFTPSGTINSTFNGTAVETESAGNHNHLFDGWAIKWGNVENVTHIRASMAYGTTIDNNPYITANSTTSAGAHTHKVTAKGTVSSTFSGTKAQTEATGSGEKFSTIDPYITVYMYKRVS